MTSTVIYVHLLHSLVPVNSGISQTEIVTLNYYHFQLYTSVSVSGDEQLCITVASDGIHPRSISLHMLLPA